MRFFEISLILSITLFLVYSTFKSLNKQQRFLSILVICLLGILHFLTEGFRWQLIPLYVLLLFLVIGFYLKSKPSKVRRLTFRFFCFSLLLFSSLLCYTFPVLNFRNNNGPFNVGVEQFHLVDNQRGEFLTKDSGDKREVSLRIFYPTPEEHNSSYPYIPDFEQIRSAYKNKLGWPDFMLDYLKLFTVEALEKAPYFDEKSFPIIFYSHGLTNNYNEASGRLLQIASNGYVVVALNHTYSSDFGYTEKGKVVGYKALSILGDPIEKVDSVKTLIARQWYDDVKFVERELMNRKISKSIDFKRVALMGFSAGGTMSTLGGYNHENIKAVINLDGTPRGLINGKKANAPYLGMFSEPLNFSDEQLEAWGIEREVVDAPKKMIKERSFRVMSSSPSSSYLITIPRTKHSNFIEYPLISPFSSFLGIGGEIESNDCYEFQNRIIKLFLDKNLKSRSDIDIHQIIEIGINEFGIEVQST